MLDAMYHADVVEDSAPVRWLSAYCQRSAQPLAYTIVLGLAILAAAGSHVTGLRFGGMQPQLQAIGVMALLLLIYRRRQPTMQLADMASYGILWLSFMLFGAMLTYIAASTALPLQDATLAAFDARLGFDWLAWNDFVERHPLLNMALGMIYTTIFPQVVIAIIYFAVTRRPERNDELWMTATLTLLVTTVGFALAPALGAGIHFDRMEMPMRTYLPDLLKLRDGAGLHQFVLGEMQGIITMPSYHAVLATIIPIAFRGVRFMFWGALLLNGVMMFSVPSHGSHYLVDMIAGVVVALSCSWCVQRLLRAIAARRH